MPDPPEISVILPFYRDQDTLQDAIESVLEQTFDRFELLLVSNNAPAECTEIARQAQAKDARIRSLEEKGQGPALASQTAYQVSKGRYLARMDADDVSLPTRLDKQFRFLENHPEIDVVSCQVALFADHRRSLKGFQHFIDWNNGLLTPEQIWLNRFVEIPLINPSLFFRKSVADKYGLYMDGDFPEDYDMQLRWLDRGVAFAKLPEILLHWRDRDKRLTRTDERYRQEAFYWLKAFYLAKWLERSNEQRPIGIWGAGRVSRKRAAFLEEMGIAIDFYIDIVPQKTQAKRCIHFHDLPHPNEVFIISYVAKRNAREKIKAHLLHKGFQEGKDFLLAA